jgi:hypothetical protein
MSVKQNLNEIPMQLSELRLQLRFAFAQKLLCHHCSLTTVVL